MTALEWLLSAAVVWSVFFLYLLLDVPSLVHWKRGRR